MNDEPSARAEGFYYKWTADLPQIRWAPITDPVEMALAKILSPPDLEELLPAPIPFSERQPGPEDCFEVKNTAWTMHYYWLARSILHVDVERLIWDWKPIPYASERGWEQWTHWLPVSTRFLPTRVEG